MSPDWSATTTSEVPGPSGVTIEHCTVVVVVDCPVLVVGGGAQNNGVVGPAGIGPRTVGTHSNVGATCNGGTGNPLGKVPSGMAHSYYPGRRIAVDGRNVMSRSLARQAISGLPRVIPNSLFAPMKPLEQTIKPNVL